MTKLASRDQGFQEKLSYSYSCILLVTPIHEYPFDLLRMNEEDARGGYFGEQSAVADCSQCGSMQAVAKLCDQ